MKHIGLILAVSTITMIGCIFQSSHYVLFAVRVVSVEDETCFMYDASSLKARSYCRVPKNELLRMFGSSFWATVCKTVRPMLSDRCMS